MPVDARVAAILRPIWPDLPMPVTISRPLMEPASAIAASNRAASEPGPVDASAARSAAMPACSSSRVRRAEPLAEKADSATAEVLTALSFMPGS